MKMQIQTKSKYHHKYSEEEINWLIDNYGRLGSFEATIKFNELFDLDVCQGTIKSYISKYKIPYKKYSIVTSKRVYSFEEINWLKSNYNKYNSWEEVTKYLNKEFNKNYRWINIRELCNKKLKLKLDKNITQYGLKVKEELPLGTIKDSSNGVTYIKVKMLEGAYKTKKNHGYTEPYWLPLQKHIYIQKYGKIRKNEFIIFLDGNRQNFDIDNLCCVNNKIFGQLNLRGYYGKGELTRAMVEVIKAEIEITLVEV